eukprot:512464-Rhodomonas_salina.1
MTASRCAGMVRGSSDFWRCSSGLSHAPPTLPVDLPESNPPPTLFPLGVMLEARGVLSERGVPGPWPSVLHVSECQRSTSRRGSEPGARRRSRGWRRSGGGGGRGRRREAVQPPQCRQYRQSRMSVPHMCQYRTSPSAHVAVATPQTCHSNSAESSSGDLAGRLPVSAPGIAEQRRVT